LADSDDEDPQDSSMHSVDDDSEGMQ